MNKRQKQRLQKLADFLRTVPGERFDMDHYASSKKFGKNVCGTSACAMGWATVVFPRSLKLRWYSYGYGEVTHKRNGGDALDVAREFFGVGYRAHETLFGSEPSTPKDKADQIERYLKNYEVINEFTQ